MSLASYADLQTQVANWLARDDLTAYIPDFITVFEAAAARKLKVRPQETLVSISTTNGVGTLPTDFLGWRRVTWTGSPRTELTYVAPPSFQYEFPTQPSDYPSIFTIEGSSIKIMPINDTGIEMLYEQRTTALASALNWLYTTHPDAYLFGTLAEANAFMKNATVAALWKARRDEVFDEIEGLDRNERQGLSVRVMGPTP